MEAALGARSGDPIGVSSLETGGRMHLGIARVSTRRLFNNCFRSLDGPTDRLEQ